MLTAISPIDGRYESKTAILSDYFSEHALIKYRVRVELLYLIELSQLGLKNLPALTSRQTELLNRTLDNYQVEDSLKIKEIEATTNHDVKAVEYYIKDILEANDMSEIKEFVHFGLTSQDINNTALPLMLKDAMHDVVLPLLDQVIQVIEGLAKDFRGIPMLAKTHGQPATPTTLGKEFLVYAERLSIQKGQLSTYKLRAKFGGATGNLNAHKVTYPDTDWIAFADRFIQSMELERMEYTTQIAHYDEMSYIFDLLKRISTILIDLCQDIWSYISMEYFKQKTVKGEIGSSTMPHKVNPIDFENAEGNLKYANAIFNFLSEKLPVSRLQRDLTDSTVGRNIGVPIAHAVIAYKSLLKGMSKLLLNQEAIDRDLNRNWAVVAEAIQSILRREKYPNPYEALKELTRGKANIGEADIKDFIETLDVADDIKVELSAISPFNYIGYF